MKNVEAFDQHANAARAAIGKPPVRRYDDLPGWVVTPIGELFITAGDYDRKMARELRSIVQWVDHRQKMATWDAYGRRHE